MPVFVNLLQRLVWRNNDIGVSKGLPGLSHVDHVGLTVTELDAAARFYCDVMGGYELYRLGPFDAADMPRMADGRDWTAAHINVAGARLTIAMISIGPNLMPVVLDQGPCATTRVNYVLDPFNNQIELVEYTTWAFEASSPVKIYRP
jgi:hypothetical protein